MWVASASRWRPRIPEPLRLRCWMRSPVAWDIFDGVTIEGAIQSAVVLLETGETPDDIFAGYRGKPIDIPTPIADVEIDNVTIACASWGRPSRDAFESVRVRRQRPRAELYDRATVQISGGPTKQNQIPTPTMVTPFVEFDLVADRRILLQLLPEVTAISRGRAGGLGAIAGHELTTASADHSLVRDGLLARVIPDTPDTRNMARSSSYTSRMATTRSPYWLRYHRRQCLVPV